MIPLTPSEEKLMQLLWHRKKALLKDLMADFPEPKPAKTTLATLLKRLIDKNAVAYTTQGSARSYYPLVSKSDYSKSSVSNLVSRFFNGSMAQLASYCTAQDQLSTDELEQLKEIIDIQLKRKES
ncbi:BlaI/MecI/CopY family transcriptional regulator [Sediminicola luteus]|uniref:Penicillinase repressor n=1 Tax=Sediminicola luteus TaxID=319238 RepID=A0A2A4GDT9_9FLAO|nr:BlaI/MecI/CopY family transcriptional regulator [Sediminicola luteus]PCE66581.1 penicillinase repressor [Sediminicola luteus]